MKLEDRAVLAAQDEKEKNELIAEYQNFILSSASKVLKRSVTNSDDEFMTAMLAFSEAIDNYDKNKGGFLSFASLIIRSRIIDSIRREVRHKAVPFSALKTENDEGDNAGYEVSVEENGDLKWEIEALTAELENFGISFFELAQVTPKSRKTKRVCFEAVRYVAENEELVRTVMKKRMLPIKEITDNIKSNRKTLERHRKYIITAIIAVTQDYPGIAEYFNIREV